MADPKIKYDIEANVSGNADVGKLATQIEQLAATLDGDLKTSALASADALRQLAAKDNAIQNFVDLKREAQSAAQGLKAAQDAAQAMGQQLAATETPTRAQTGQMAKLTAAVQAAKTEVITSNTALNQARGVLEQYGVSTKGLSLTQVQVKTAISDATAQVKAQAPAWQASASAANASAGQQVQASKQISEGMRSVSDQIGNAKNMVLAFAGAQGLSGSIKDVAALADAWSNMRSRLQLALGAQADINQAMVDVEGVSKRTYTSLEATSNLYGKIATAGKEMGVSQQQALAITETINRAIQLSGASAQASEAAVTQLIQGLQSGVVRGDEFNSIMEQSPRLAKAMADGMNVPIGSLRGLAEQGKLTSQTVIRALQEQSGSIEKEFASMPVTIGRAVQNVQTEWQKFVGTMDSATGASTSVAAGIESVGRHLDDLARIAAASGAALTAAFAIQAAQALRTAALEMAATGGAAALLRRNLDTLSKPVTIAIAVTGFEVGFQVGEMLRENFALARQFGVGVVGFFQLLVNDLRLLKDAAAAVFTSDTVDAALDRYVQRNKEIGATLSDMFAEAEKAPGQVGAAVVDATGKTQALGTAAQASGAAVANAGAAGAAGVAKIGKAAEDARGALEGLANVINTAAPVDNGLSAIVRDLTAAKARAVDVDLVLRQQLPDAIAKLSGPELSKFRADFIRAMDEAGFKGKELRSGLGLIAQQAAQSLGVDVPLAFNTLSESFRASQANMAVLIRDLPALKAAGVDTGMAVKQALAGMVDGAKSRAELDAVRAQVEVLRKTLGEKVTGDLLEQVADKARKLNADLQDTEKAFQRLGVMSKSALKDLADQAAKDFERVKASGDYTADTLTAAWKKMAEAAISANGGVATDAIKSEAAMRGLEVQTDATGKSIIKAMGSGSAAADGFGASVRAATNDIHKQQAALDKLKTTSDGFKMNADGSAAGNFNSSTANSDLFLLREKQTKGTLSAADLDAAKTALAQARAAQDWLTSMQSVSPSSVSPQAVTSSQADVMAARMVLQAVTAKAGQQQTTTQATTPASTVNVRITLPNGTSQTVPTTQAGAAALIASLQGAKLAAGG